MDIKIQKVIVEPHYPLQLSGQTDQGWMIGLSEKSFAFLIARIWNDLPLDAAAYESLPSFSLCIHKLNFFRIKHVKEIMGKYSEFLTADSPKLNGERVRWRPLSSLWWWGFSEYINVSRHAVVSFFV